MSKRLKEIHPNMYVTDDETFPLEYDSEFGTIMFAPCEALGEQDTYNIIKEIQSQRKFVKNMSFKTGGRKAKFKRPEYGYPEPEYTIFCALESCSDVVVYKMFDDKREEVSIDFGGEDDCANGKNSLIDVMYYLKHKPIGVHKFDAPWEDIVIEEMTREDMELFKKNF